MKYSIRFRLVFDRISALNAATKIDPAVNQGTVAILVPHWANDADAGRSYPVTSGVSVCELSFKCNLGRDIDALL